MAEKHTIWSILFRRLGRMGVKEEIAGIASHVLSIGLILAVVWGVDHFYLQILRSTQGNDAGAAYAAQDQVSLNEDYPAPELPVIEALADDESSIRRASLPHTSFPTRPRRTITSYTVEEGDHLFSIAEKFSLHASSILWANNTTLRDDPHNLRAGQKLIILAGDGAYYEWHTGDSLASVAEFYGVLPADIINSPANRLHNAPLTENELESGMGLFIPGGKRDFVTWQIPRITRQDTDAAQVLGRGTCAALDSGPIGEGSFVWPTLDHQISGYPFAPQANHYGIDIYGNPGDPVYATDAGVSVYSGWNDWGLGNIIVLDHGNGWQSLYAQLGVLKIGCGQMVNQGDVIAEMGISGNSESVQLHFELMNDEFGRTNPVNLLP
jgi:murein DD-endopeptidase MepM/ murein hydrolase activator NlpD